MTALGAWLLVVGVCDLLRATRDTITRRHTLALLGLGLALLVLAGLWLRPSLPGAVVLGGIWTAGLVGWLVASSPALDPGSPHHRRWRAAAFAALLVPVALLALLGGAVTTRAVVPDRLDGALVAAVPADVLVLLAGVAVFQLSSANIAVRLLLDAIGVPAVTHEKKLKGGRLLGPMERLFLLGLALAGQLGAAAVVVAAKGLLRYPELQRTEREAGPTDVSEYFLIGSFASWLVALVGVALVRLG